MILESRARKRTTTMEENSQQAREFCPRRAVKLSVHVLRGVTSLVPWTTKGSEYFIAFHLLFILFCAIIIA